MYVILTNWSNELLNNLNLIKSFWDLIYFIGLDPALLHNDHWTWVCCCCGRCCCCCVKGPSRRWRWQMFVFGFVLIAWGVMIVMMMTMALNFGLPNRRTTNKWGKAMGWKHDCFWSTFFLYLLATTFRTGYYIWPVFSFTDLINSDYYIFISFSTVIINLRSLGNLLFSIRN